MKVAPRPAPTRTHVCALTMETFSPGVRGGLSFTAKRKKKMKKKTGLYFLYHEGEVAEVLDFLT